jgi:hypothetical protein
MRFLVLFFVALRVFGAPPGTVIDHSAKASGLYVGSPSIVILPGGKYLASHDFFGPKSGEFEAPTTVVFESGDRGGTWRKAATLKGLFWAGLFVHDGAAYLMGTDRHHGRIVIRRSMDEGRTWTEPVDAAQGLITARAEYHTAPTPVIEHEGRLWRAFEDASGGTQWGARYMAMMLSARTDADLLNATNWVFSRTIGRNPQWLEGKFNGWLEGNAVAGPDGGVVNVMRVDVSSAPEKAAILSVSRDGAEQNFDPARQFVDFPGGSKKFTIRFDPKSGAYWALANAILDDPKGSEFSGKPSGIRNTLVLLKSRDLREWEQRAVLLHHPDSTRHAFQYADWQFDGEDMIAAVRTAYDDGEGGAHNAHDANYLTFHRFRDFRNLRSTEAAGQGN